MTHLAVPAISEEMEPEEPRPARSASTEQLSGSRHNSVRSGGGSGDDDGSVPERGRSYSSTLSRTRDHTDI